MDNSMEFLNPEFSLEKLAGYVDSKYKTVSQVINEKYGGNFNTFVNKYRINEACRRIADREHYGNYTLDAISKSVGFRSRTTFLKAFKTFTGLSPSEFLRMASK